MKIQSVIWLCLTLALTPSLACAVDSTSSIDSSLHSANIRKLIAINGMMAGVSAPIAQIKATVLQEIAARQHVTKLSAADVAKIESLSNPIIMRLQDRLSNLTANYMSPGLTDADIDELTIINQNPLMQKFISTLAVSQTNDQILIQTYISDTSNGIVEAYKTNTPYKSHDIEAEDGAASQLYAVTGNTNMAAMAVQHLFLYLILADMDKQLHLNTLSESENVRLYPLIQQGLYDFYNRLTAHKIQVVGKAFTPEEIAQLNKLSDKDSVKRQTAQVVSIYADMQNDVQAAYHAAHDEILAAIPK